MKKNMVTVIAIAGVFISSLTPTTFAAVVSVEPAYQEVSKGEEFTVNITVDPDGDEIYGAQCSLLFDNDLLQVLRQDKGSFLSQDGTSTMEIINVIDNTTGKTEYGEMRKGTDYGITTPGVLTAITFKAIEPGTSSLNLSNIVLSDPNGYELSGISVNNGTYRIRTTATTSTSTPTPATGSGDSSNGGESTTPTPAYVLPTEKAGPTPAQTSIIKSVITPIPSPSPIITTPSLTPPATSLPSTEKNGNKRLPGFGTGFAIVALLLILYLMLKGGGDRKSE